MLGPTQWPDPVGPGGEGGWPRAAGRPVSACVGPGLRRGRHRPLGAPSRRLLCRLSRLRALGARGGSRVLVAPVLPSIPARGALGEELQVRVQVRVLVLVLFPVGGRWWAAGNGSGAAAVSRKFSPGGSDPGVVSVWTVWSVMFWSWPQWGH